MLNGTACGLLLLLLPLLLGGLAVALAMNAFPPLSLLALGAVALPGTVLTTNQTLVVTVPTVPLRFNASGLGTLVSSFWSVALPCSLVSAAATDLASCPFAVCRRAASLASITAWSRRCWSMMLNSASWSCIKRLNLISFPFSLRNSSASIPAAITSTITLPCLSVYCRPPGFTTSVRPLSTKYFRRARSCMNTLQSTSALAYISAHGRYGGKIYITRLLHINASKRLEPVLQLLLGEINPGSAIVEFAINHHLRRRIHQLSPPREHPVSSVFTGEMHLLPILQVSNKKFAHIFEDNNIPTQPRRCVSPDSHLNLRRQPATGSASTSRASKACRMDTASALRSRFPRICIIAHCLQLVSHTNNSSTMLSGLQKTSRLCWAVSRIYPTQLNCTDSRPRARC